MSFLANLEAVLQKDEEWVVAEIRRGWSLVQSAEHQAEIDVLNLFHWIQAHQADALNLMNTVLTDIKAVGSVAGALVPGYGPSIVAGVQIATTALQAATAGITVLAQGIQQGSTPMSTVSNAYTQVKTAVNAVNNVLKAATTPTSGLLMPDAH
jgi:hypothetical protein